MKKVVVIGGGLGGLSCAIRLAVAGFSVTVIEKEPQVGGKLKQETIGDYSFDLGPSTITMKAAFEKVFEQAGRRMEDYLTFDRFEPLNRNVFADGSVVDWTSDVSKMEAQIAKYSKEDAKRYKDFIRKSGEFYSIAETRFLNQLLLSWKDKTDPKLLRDFAKIKPFTSLHAFLKKYFTHPNTLAMFGRYATYVGGSPYQAPAIFSMMAHLEASLGIYSVKGGTYSIVKAFEKLACELGVVILTGERVNQIRVRNGKAVGAETDKAFYDADWIVANGDALTVYQNLLNVRERPSMSDRKISAFEPSLSGFVLLLGVEKVYESLLHHNVFFPENYKQEFVDIFLRKRPPEDPTIYVCYSGATESDKAPDGSSNLFVLVNAPYLTDQWNWRDHKQKYADFVMAELEKRGLKDLSKYIAVQKIVTPEDWQQKTGAYNGGIYGISSNGFRQAFFRPSNQAKDVKGLWFVGGTTHPGGGTPIVTLSGQLVAEKIINEVG